MPDAIKIKNATVLLDRKKVLYSINLEVPDGIILKKGKILADGPRDQIITEGNITNAFDIEVSLTKTEDNRFWTVVKQN